MLVAASIYDACKYFSLFQKTEFKGKCAVVTSYNPHAQDVAKEETGANTETDKQFIYTTYTELLKDVDANPGQSKTETYEERAKDLFVKQPATISAATPRSQPISKNASHSGPRSTKRPWRWCAPTPTSPTSSKPPAIPAKILPASNGSLTTT
jgi:hypothetical protein